MRPRVVWPLLVSLVAGLVYLNTLSNGFALDDVPLVRDNVEIRHASSIPQLLTRPYWPQGGQASGLYRPATIVSLAVNRAIGGAGATGFHVGNLLLHMAVCFLAWFALRGSGPHYGTAMLGGLLFAVHPLHTEAVANIAGRAELLGALGVVAAWLAHRRFRQAADARSAAGWLGLAGGCYLLAVLSKENMVLAPLLFLIDDRLDRGSNESAAPRPAWPVFLSYAGVLVVAAVGRYAALGGLLRGASDVAFLDNPAAFSSVGVRLATASWVQVEYLRLFLWPFGLSSDYSHATVPLVSSALDLRLWAGLAWVAALIALLIFGLARSRTLALAAAIWILFFLPGSNFLFPVGTLMAERLAYLPSLGACLAVGHLAAGLAARKSSSRERVPAIVAAGSLLVVLFSWGTWMRNPDWRNNETLALRDVETKPRSAKLQAGAAIVLHDRGDLDEAETAYLRSIEIYPDYAQAHYNFGVLLVAKGVTERAIEHLQRAAALAPGNPGPPKTLAPILERMGRRDPALEAYAAGSLLDPGDLGFRFNYGRFLLVSDRDDEARRVLRRLAQDDAGGLVGTLALGLFLESEGRADKAREVYEDLLRNPSVSPGIRANVEQRLRLMAGRAP